VANEETTTPVNENINGGETVETVAESPQPGAAHHPDTHTEGAQLKAQLEEYLAGWQRTRAEFANYKKRTDKELGESRQRGSLDTLAKVLPIVDDFERAMSNIPGELQGNPWMNGVSLLLKKFEKLLSEHEVTVIDPVGQPFDPSRHEAIGMDDSDTVESGHVTVTLQKGYISGDKVLRPALVRVAN
jgi:molecular chaperone GrpE